MRLAGARPSSIPHVLRFAMKSRHSFAVALALAAWFALGALAQEREVDEKRSYFTEVARELAARPHPELTQQQAAQRQALLNELVHYADAGVFTVNTDFPGIKMPYFVDRRGTRCAVAHLIEFSGHGDLLQRLAEEANNSFAAELTADPELLGWLDEVGLTLDEVAYIQM